MVDIDPLMDPTSSYSQAEPLREQEFVTSLTSEPRCSP